MPLLRALVPALLSGALFAAALPPVSQWWLAWFWMLPLLWKLWVHQDAFHRPRRPFWYGFRHGWLTGFFAFGFTLWWVGHVTVLGVVLMCMYLALFPAVWGGFAALLRPSSPARGLLASLALSLLWAGLELLRGTLLTGFPWNGAAVPLAEMPGLRGLAAWTGVTGLSSVPVFFMSGLAAAWVLRTHRSVRSRAVILCATLALPAIITVVLWEKSPAPLSKLQVMLVQPNFPREDPGEMANIETEEQERALRARWTREMNEQLASLKSLVLTGMKEARTRPDLIVWPESGLPTRFHSQETFALLEELFAAGASTLLIGSDVQMPPLGDDANTDTRTWPRQNCAALVHGNYRNYELYAKVHLVPFGEYLPLRDKIPLLEKWLGHLILEDFTPGTVIQPMRAEGMGCEIIPLICFEDTIAPLARQFVRPAPQIIVNITNDNWFYQSNESAIHALNARWRCIELRRPMVRASLTGVTCAIDTEGRITDEMPRWQPGVLHASVPIPPADVTFYARHGDLFSTWFGSAGLLLALGLIFKRPHTS